MNRIDTLLRETRATPVQYTLVADVNSAGDGKFQLFGKVALPDERVVTWLRGTFFVSPASPTFFVDVGDAFLQVTARAGD